MTLVTYWQEVRKLCDDHSLRKGQAAFNVLQDMRPKMAEEIRGTVLDPFYCSTLSQQYKDFINYLNASWDLKETQED